MKQIIKKKKISSWKKTIFIVLSSLLGIAFIVVLGFFLWIQTWKTYVSPKGITIKYPSSWSATEDNQAFNLEPPEHPLSITRNGGRTTIYVSRLTKDSENNVSAFLREKSTADQKHIPLLTSFVDGKRAWGIIDSRTSSQSIYIEFSRDYGQYILWATANVNKTDSSFFDAIVSLLIFHTLVIQR